jgi:hypothetical protein
MRALYPRYAAESDEDLIDALASENPQCRLVKKGENVSLENLSSILFDRPDRQAEPVALHSEPMESAPTMDTPVKPTLFAGFGANGSSWETARIEWLDKVKPIWVGIGVVIIGLLAFAGYEAYYVQHAKVESPNNASPEATKPQVESDFYSAKYIPVGNGWASLLVKTYDFNHKSTGEQGILFEMQ